jgi:hypothetical protein
MNTDLSAGLSLYRRRLLLWPPGLLLAAHLPHARGLVPGEPAAEALAAAALRTLRRVDANPSWMTSANWGNRHYDPWTDYLAGRMSESEFATVCARPSDYCLRDVWNLKKRKPEPIDWRSQTQFNWNGIHALALRFFRSGDGVYLSKWLDVVTGYAQWTLSQPPHADLVRGLPAALLDAAFAWGGILTALAIIAKGLGATPEPGARPERPRGTPPDRQRPLRPGSPFDANDAALDTTEITRIPADALVQIATALATRPGPLLARHYGEAKYVPNQRAFGLEALALLDAAFGALPAVAALRQATQAGLLDVFTRYRQLDGGQLEQSFNYGQDVVNAATRCMQLPAPGVTAPPWLDQARETRTGWWRMAAALATPEGALPQLGNAAWGRYGRPGPREPALRLGVPSIALPYSGLYAMRSDASPDAAYLFFFVRRAARGHSMAGSNSIQLAAYGRQLLGAGGSASYGGRAAGGAGVVAYLGENSSFKTSTVLVDGRSQAGASVQGLPRDADGRPDITRVPQSPVAARWHASPRLDYVEGLYAEGWKGTLEDPSAAPVNDVSHWRQVIFVRELMLWVVVDVLRSSAEHRYTQVWKFPPPKNGLAVPGFQREQVLWSAADRSVRTADKAPGAVNLSLLQFGAVDMSYRGFFGDAPYGFFAAGPLSEPVPAVDVHASWQGRGPQVVMTLLVPHRGAAPAIEKAREISSAGQAGVVLTMQGGRRLTVQAAATPQPLSAGGQRVAEADLLLLVDVPGRPPAGLIISQAGSHSFDGKHRWPINVPQGFRWRDAPDGTLAPDYDG